MNRYTSCILCACFIGTAATAVFGQSKASSDYAIESERIAIAYTQPAADKQEVPDQDTSPKIDLSAPSEPARATSISLLWDNDTSTFNPIAPSDKWYTNAVRLSYNPAAERTGSPLDKLLKSIPGLGHTPTSTAWALSVTQEIYTPATTFIDTPIVGDRPYAAWLYAGFALQRASANTLDHWELKLGATGDYAGGQGAQKGVHRLLFNQTRPAGWGNQIDERFTAEVDLRRLWRTTYDPEQEGWQWQLIPELGTRLGNTRVDARAGFTLRLGFNLPDDFGPPRLQGVIDASRVSYQKNGLYFFARATGEAIAYDLFVEGNTPTNNALVSLQPIVGQVQVGLMGNYHRLRYGYAITWVTKRFRQQPSHQSFGSYFLSYQFDF